MRRRISFETDLSDDKLSFLVSSGLVHVEIFTATGAIEMAGDNLSVRDCPEETSDHPLDEVHFSDPLLDSGGYLVCGCHGSQRDHTCGPSD